MTELLKQIVGYQAGDTVMAQPSWATCAAFPCRLVKRHPRFPTIWEVVDSGGATTWVPESTLRRVD